MQTKCMRRGKRIAIKRGGQQDYQEEMETGTTKLAVAQRGESVHAKTSKVEQHNSEDVGSRPARLQ